MICKRRWYVVATFITICAVSGCDKESVKESDTVEGSEETSGAETQEPFTWQDALQSSPEQAREALGAFEGCDPDKPLKPAEPQWRKDLFKGPILCKFTEEPARPHDDYQITYIVYSENTPVMVRLSPRTDEESADEWRVDEWRAKLELPDFPIERRFRIGRTGVIRQMLRYPATELPEEPGAVVGADFLTFQPGDGSEAQADKPSHLPFATVYALDSKGAIADYLQMDGNSPARAELVLPMVLGAYSLDDTLYTEIGLDTVRVDNSTPTRTGPGANNQMESFARAELSESDSDWRDKLVGPVARAKKEAELLNEEFERLMNVAAERTLPSAEVLELMNAARTRADIHKFKLLGRDPSGLDPSDPRNGRVGVANVLLITGLVEPRVPSDDAPLNLTVDIQPKGFNITAGGKALAAIEGCDEPGPTICRTDAKVDVAKALQEAQKLQRKGEFEASQEHVQAVLSTYDWAGLYNQLSALKQAHPEEKMIYIRLQNADAPVAVLTQLMNTARWKLRAADTEAGECAEEFTSNAEALAAVPCESEQEISKMFPDVAIFAAP